MTSSPASALRERMATQAVFGTFLKLGRREVVEIMAQCGFDFAICDLEHSQMTESEAGLLMLAARACDFPVVVRVPGLDAGLINRLLEAGAAGIQLPQLRSEEDTTAFEAAAKYPPQGSRSISLAQPAASYGAEPLADYIQRSNEEVLLVGQLESREVESTLDQLISGLDVAFIGTLDLTVDMGVPGRVDDPAVVQRLREIEAAAASANVPLGIYADSPARALQAAAAGYRYIALSSDLGALRGAARGWIQQLQEAAAGRQA